MEDNEFCTETKTSQNIRWCIEELLEDFHRKKPCGFCVSHGIDDVCGNWKSCNSGNVTNYNFTCCYHEAY